MIDGSLEISELAGTREETYTSLNSVDELSSCGLYHECQHQAMVEAKRMRAHQLVGQSPLYRRNVKQLDCRHVSEERRHTATVEGLFKFTLIESRPPVRELRAAFHERIEDLSSPARHWTRDGKS